MPDVSQPSPRVLASRRNGALGGKARAAKHSKAQLQEWASRGGNATQDLYGSDFKKFMNKQKKTHGRYNKPAALCNVKGSHSQVNA